MRVMVVRTGFPEASRPGSLKAPEVPDILQHPQQEGNKNRTEPTLLNGKASSGSMGVWQNPAPSVWPCVNSAFASNPQHKGSTSSVLVLHLWGALSPTHDDFPAAKFSS